KKKKKKKRKPKGKEDKEGIKKKKKEREEKEKKEKKKKEDKDGEVGYSIVERKILPTHFSSFPNSFLCYLSAARRGEVEEES
ncbi:hypothetical protein, partial [Picosynechococcus sp. PCC 7002]|uniref:hypothetical protein n=1 Tax=Picosynechococcus sp. (strain ATCC 27264 / PCC 7002 / PR-6) TaxID=32049 RepID=UPI001C3CD3C8